MRVAFAALPTACMRVALYTGVCNYKLYFVNIIQTQCRAGSYRYNIIAYLYQWRSFEFAPGVFYTYLYNHARRLRLEKFYI